MPLKAFVRLLKKPSSSRLLIFFLLATIAFVHYLSYGFHLPTTYQARDLNRALDLFQGHFTWPGPELSGGGRLPGPFYYWLLALPLSVSTSVESPLIFLYLMSGIAAAIVWYFLETTFSRAVGLAGYFLFLNSVAIRTNITSYWNPSYSIALLVLVIGLRLKFPKAMPRRFLVVSGLLCGLSLQLHMTTILVWLPLALVGFWSDEGTLRDRAKGFLIFSLAAAAPLVPYFIWEMTNQAPDISMNRVSSGASSLLQPLAFVNDNVVAAGKTFATVLQDLFGTDLFLLVAVISLFVFRRNPFAGNRFLVAAFFVSALFLPYLGYEASLLRYTLPFFLLLVIALAIATGPVVERFPIAIAVLAVAYVLLLSRVDFRVLVHELTGPRVLLQMALAACVVPLLVSKLSGQRRKAGLLLAVLFLSTIAHAVLDRHAPTAFGNEELKGVEIDVPEAKRMMKSVVSRTNWPYDTFRERTVIWGVGHELDLSIVYEEELAKARRTPGSVSTPQREEYDGILIVSKSPAEDVELTEEGFRAMIAKRPRLGVALAAALQDGSGRCTHLEKSEFFVTCFYELADAARTISWNNIGYPYRTTEPLLAGMTASTGVVVMSPTEAIFYVTVCKSPEPSCYSYFRVALDDGLLAFTAYGDPLGTPESMTNPAWALSAKDVRLTLICGEKRSQFDIAANLGAGMDREGFLAPYRIARSLPCADPTRVELALHHGENFYRAFEHDLLNVDLVWQRK